MSTTFTRMPRETESAVKCPKCAAGALRVIDTRLTKKGRRRIYACMNCRYRFKTLEMRVRAKFDPDDGIFEFRGMNGVGLAKVVLTNAEPKEVVAV